MRSRIYRVALLSLCVLAALASVAYATSQGTATVNSVEPGQLGKTLQITKIDQDTARLTIVGHDEQRSSIVVYGGDVRLGLWAAGVTPEAPAPP